MRALVLVVDDEPLILLGFEGILEAAGYDVICCPSADAAKALLEQRPDVSLVCTDMRMPGHMDGLSLTRWIKVNRPELPVILVSGDGTRQDVSSIANATLTKPIITERLLAKVAELLELAQMVRQ